MPIISRNMSWNGTLLTYTIVYHKVSVPAANLVGLECRSSEWWQVLTVMVECRSSEWWQVLTVMVECRSSEWWQVLTVMVECVWQQIFTSKIIFFFSKALHYPTVNARSQSKTENGARRLDSGDFARENAVPRPADERTTSALYLSKLACYFFLTNDHFMFLRQ